MIYRIVHRTEYRYPSEVSSSFGEVYLLPRDTPGQVCRSSPIHIHPEPHDFRERTDFYGNRVASFTVLEPHTVLAVTAGSVVNVVAASGATLSRWPSRGRRARDARAAAQWTTRSNRHFLHDSPKIVISPAVRAYGAESFTPGGSR